MARYTEAEAKAFISYIAPKIKAEGNRRGYSIVSPTIAQSVIEGACGKSELAQPPHSNHFGLKCGKAWLKANMPAVNMRTGEEYNGKYVRINDWFRSYPGGDESCISGYYDFISTKRYSNLKSAVDAYQFIEYLKRDGYATSSKYVQTLTDTVNKYNLTIYDEVVVPEYVRGVIYTTNVNLKIRITPDGERKAYADITENAKRHSFMNDQGYAVLKKGSRVTCRDIIKIDDAIWMEIPSGYIAAYYDKKIYIS